MSKVIKVGYLNNTYPYKRNIINIVQNSEYIKIKNVYKINSKVLRTLYKFKILKNNDWAIYYENSFNYFNIPKVDVIHFFNNVSFGNIPWIATFETFIPRYSILLNHQNNGINIDKKVEKALNVIASDKCKKIIAISQCTYNFQKKLLEMTPMLKSKIEKKLCIIHPPQQLFINSYKEKNLKYDEIKFIFVGRDFFRKGGLEILKAFKYIKDKYNYQIRLTIISSLNYNDYATQYGKKEYDLAKKIILENKEWIEYYKGLSNEKVLELIKSNHIGLLPTWADTYGYSVLEMQACGCPVITTNIRALPEINDNKKGWMINIPKNEFGEALYITQQHRDNISKIIEKELRKIIIEIFEDKNSIQEKANLSIKNIKDNHSIEEYEKKIKSIYYESI